MKSNQNEFKSNWAQNQLFFTKYRPNPDKIEIKSALKLKKWYKNKNAVTGSNHWKFDNKIPKIEPNISLISKPSNQWKLIIKSSHFQWNSMKI